MSVNMTALNQYQSVNLEVAVASASSHQLIVMLYDGALRSLAQAKGCIERKDIQSRTKHLNKANDIIFGLRDFLNHEKGGEISANLDGLYQYMINAIVEANRVQDAEKIQQVIELLLELKAGWAGMPLDIRMGQEKLELMKSYLQLVVTSRRLAANFPSLINLISPVSPP